MKLIWTQSAWIDYMYWQKKDKQILSKINKLIKEIMREPFNGIGKPEPLKNELSGFWSRRINQEHRLIYEVADDFIAIISCRYHYK